MQLIAVKVVSLSTKNIQDNTGVFSFFFYILCDFSQKIKYGISCMFQDQMKPI